MTTEPEDLVPRIHASGRRFVMAITGGGSEAIGELLRVPGASRTLLEAMVPYSAESLTQFLGARPEHFCCARTARAMAMAAYWRAVELSSREGEEGLDPDSILGIGCTASLASDRPKRGPHRVHVAVQAAGFTDTLSLELLKDARSRAAEERVAARLVLSRIAAAADVAPQLDLDLLDGEQVTGTRTDAPDDWRDLLLGEVDAVCVGGPETESESHQPSEPGGGHPLQLAESDPEEFVSPAAIFSGAFNPRHEGHRRMAEIGAQELGANVDFEISIENVDKPPLDYTEIAERAAQFTADEALWLTRAATFVEKSAIFPAATFIVGADTIVRIADPRYYGNDAAACERAIDTIAANGCRFLVFGRTGASGFESLGDLPLPEKLLAICRGVMPDRFRVDLSSTEIRKQTAGVD